VQKTRQTHGNCKKTQKTQQMTKNTATVLSRFSTVLNYKLTFAVTGFNIIYCFHVVT